ncbi:hypothetical protein CFP56_012885 [Quercus suber]|uniref:Uncharacterized protein n=1 Tax=Quercus suber TaxID=58331 RepID=A0AAW0KWU5_QUESU
MHVSPSEDKVSPGEKSPVLSYTEVLLVPLTTPDFTTKKAGRLPKLLSRLSAKLSGKEWEPPQSPSTSSSFISSKLILKVLIVAGVAVFWQYYSK